MSYWRLGSAFFVMMTLVCFWFSLGLFEYRTGTELYYSTWTYYGRAGLSLLAAIFFAILDAGDRIHSQ
jgi:hypothetical protein